MMKEAHPSLFQRSQQIKSVRKKIIIKTNHIIHKTTGSIPNEYFSIFLSEYNFKLFVRHLYKCSHWHCIIECNSIRKKNSEIIKPHALLERKIFGLPQLGRNAFCLFCLLAMCVSKQQHSNLRRTMRIFCCYQND